MVSPKMRSNLFDGLYGCHYQVFLTVEKPNFLHCDIVIYSPEYRRLKIIKNLPDYEQAIKAADDYVKSEIDPIN